ncbi:hypothetical protein DID75_03530 [Candidatus Marinamargulisbacteria bacterium SCGC AG-410-N11]|nr:hypothetical protein DID75_03530 [Candidatus Marinamargulisbacteria bacterium SCGC AG-410-N11]
MKLIKNFLTLSLLSGLLVFLPVGISLFVINWLFKSVNQLIEPLTSLILLQFQLPPLVADMIVLGLIFAFLVIIGAFVKTKVGHFIHHQLEKRVLKIAPGYTLIKETVFQLIGRKKSPFSQVALVQLFENSTLSTAFVTDDSSSDRVTVFVPTGPNPTSGNIFHLKREFVHPVEIPVESAMRSIIGCGTGSCDLLSKEYAKMK